MRLSKIFKSGILGINARNILYIRPYNPRKSVAFADDKMKTKAFLSTRGIPVAKVYARIASREQLVSFDFGTLPDECVLKPNEGSGGEGILILKGRQNGQFLVQGKTPISERALREHIEDILEGRYSLGGRSDIAFFEQRLTAHRCFARFRPAGLPDLRIIVFNLVPVMAMLRIPTGVSGGKANVHLGGIGIGIDLAKGTTTYGAQYHNIITRLPHGGSLSGIPIPWWDDILLLCSRIQQITNIGYLACDITISEQMGPALLEVNARAGLMVQVANLAPLRSRLDRVQGLKVHSPEQGVRIGQDLFGGKIRLEVHPSTETSRVLLAPHETISIASKKKTFSIPVLIAPHEEQTVFSEDLLEELREAGVVETGEKTGTYRVRFTLAGKKIQTVCTGGFAPPPDRCIIGRRDLQGFLIDPGKKPTDTTKHPPVRTDLRAADSLLRDVDEQLLVLRYVKPINLNEERDRLAKDRRLNALFLYPELPSQILTDCERKLESEIKDDSPLGILLEKKRGELLRRIALLRARSRGHAYTEASIALFGAPTEDLIADARHMLDRRVVCELPPPRKELLTAAQAAERFREVLERYSLHDWKVEVRDRMIAGASVGAGRMYLRAQTLFSKSHIDALIAHEIETHILTAENGEHQPVALLRRGCANELDTQEGLAIFNQLRVLPPNHDRRYNAARNVLTIQFALSHSLADTRIFNEEVLGYEEEKALIKALEVKRGFMDTAEPGAFTKGLVYFRGLRKIEQFVGAEGDLRRLYIGKVALEDIDLIEQIPDLQPPLLLPRYLQEKEPGKKKR